MTAEETQRPIKGDITAIITKGDDEIIVLQMDRYELITLYWGPLTAGNACDNER